MSELSEHIALTITVESVGEARAGFGIPLILSHSAAWVERTRTYGALSEVSDDFASGTPEYRTAQALFSQSPHPSQIMIGRASLKPTQTYIVSVASVANATTYSINAVFPGSTHTNPLTYTSDADATNDEIVAGLVAALNGVTGENYTAAATGSAGSQVCTVTGNAAGNWFSLEVVNTTLLGISQSHADPGVATDLDAIKVEEEGWYCLLTNFNSKAYVLAAAAWIEAAKKLYIVDVNETEAIKVAVGSSPTDTLYTLFGLSYNRTAGSYYPSPAMMFSAAWAGRVLPDEPGSETWKFKELSGVLPVKLSSTARVNLRARKANCFTRIASKNKTWEGTVAGGSFGFIDVTRGHDWLDDDMTKSVYEAISGPEKLPYTNPGVAVVKNAVKASLKRAVARGILDENFEIEVPKVSAVPSADKAIRRLRNVKWSGTLAGAIHGVDITGSVSV